MAAVLIRNVHKYFGRYVDQTQSFDLGVALAGLTPILGFLALTLLWNPRKNS